MKEFSVRINKIIAAIISAGMTVTMVPNVQAASFMEDFFNSAGAAVNTTPAQAYKTQTQVGVTGGSMVFRAPVRTFRPFSITPPSLKYGCGGIDIFMGSFSLMTRDQFIQFMRSVGQSLPGLAFKVALEAMSPEMAKNIQDFVNMINHFNQMFTNSCQTASWLMDKSGATQWLDTLGREVSGYLTGDGVVSDTGAANEKIRTDGSSTINSAKQIYNSGNFLTDSAEMNILFTILNSGELQGLVQKEKELIMSMVGTLVLKKVEPSDPNQKADTTLAPLPYPGFLDVNQFVGDPNTVTQELGVYSCNGNTDECLDVQGGPSDKVPMKLFARLIYEKMTDLRDAIINRTDLQSPQLLDLQYITTTSSLPIYKIIQISAMPDKKYLGEDLLLNYSQAAGLEMASHYVEYIADSVRQLASAAQHQTVNGKKGEEIQKLLDRITVLRGQVQKARTEIYQKIDKSASLIDQIQHIERSIYGNLSSNLMANLNFGR